MHFCTYVCREAPLCRGLCRLKIEDAVNLPAVFRFQFCHWKTRDTGHNIILLLTSQHSLKSNEFHGNNLRCNGKASGRSAPSK